MAFKNDIAPLRSKHSATITDAATLPASGKNPPTVTAEYDGTAGDLLALILEQGEQITALQTKVASLGQPVKPTA